MAHKCPRCWCPGLGAALPKVQMWECFCPVNRTRHPVTACPIHTHTQHIHTYHNVHHTRTTCYSHCIHRHMCKHIIHCSPSPGAHSLQPHPPKVPSLTPQEVTALPSFPPAHEEPHCPGLNPLSLSPQWCIHPHCLCYSVTGGGYPPTLLMCNSCSWSSPSS